MSDPNQMVRRRQMVLIFGAIAVIAGLSIAGMFFFESGPPAAARQKPTTVTITAPGSLDDRDAWRAQQAAREKTNEARIGEVNDKLRQQEETNRRLQKELEDIRLGKTKLPEAARPSTPVSGPALDQPLPLGAAGAPAAAGNAAAGQKVLASPTAAQQRPAGGTVGFPPPSGPTSGFPLNAPLTPPAPAQKEMEIIQFGTPKGAAAAGVPGAPAGDPELLGFPVEEKAKKFGEAKGAPGARQQVEFIPAGSFVRVAMLNGIDAPTGGQAQGNPLPVAFHVLDPANLPSKYKLDIKDCRIIGAAWGDLSSERSMIRTETMSCILGNGETVEMPIRGQAIGEDGKAGLRGRLVTKQGQLLANALFAGALSGIGRAFQSSATISNSSGLGVTQTIDPDRVTQAALGGGVGQAGTMLAQYYLKAADKLFPVIETDGGRTIELLITKGAVYNGKAEVRENHRGLLKRNGLNSRKYEDD